MMDMPTINHPTDRPNFTEVGLGGLTLWFSYRTCVGFDEYDGRGPVVRENEWGPTTGKHLNYIDGGDKACRILAGNGNGFQTKLAAALARVGQ